MNLRQEAAYCERSSAILGCLRGRVCVVLEGRRKRKSGEREGEREEKKGRREEWKGKDILSGSPMLWTTVMSYLLRIPGVASGVSGASYSDRE